MNRIVSTLLMLALGSVMLLGAGCGKHAEEPKKTDEKSPGTKYTCPMHPEVVQNAKGLCPKCGMDLVEKK